MLEVKDMTHGEMDDLLDRVRYGHLGCAQNNHPYVVPIHFALDEHTIYIFTTEGKKSAILDSNPEVCLQVEEVIDDENWSSVVIVGDAEKLTKGAERDKAFAAISAANPAMTPALSFRWVNEWVREQKDSEIIYRINRKTTTGRRAGDN